MSVPLDMQEGEPWEEDVTNADLELLQPNSARSPRVKQVATRTSPTTRHRALPGSLLAAATKSSVRSSQEEMRAELRAHTQMLRRIEGLFLSELQACKDAMVEALSATRKELTFELAETCRATIQEEASKLRDEAVQLEAQTTRVAAIVGHLNEDVHKLVETPRAVAGPGRVSDSAKQRLFARLDEALKSEAFARKELQTTTPVLARDNKEKDPQSPLIAREKGEKELHSPFIPKDKGLGKQCPRRVNETQSARALGGSVRVEGRGVRQQHQQQQQQQQALPHQHREPVDPVVSPAGAGTRESPLPGRRQSPERRGCTGSVDLHGPFGRSAATPAKVATKAIYIPATPPHPQDTLTGCSAGNRTR